jgi:hypothetical protein
MQTGDDAQDPRPEDKDGDTPGPESATQSRGKHWAAHTFTDRTADEPDESEQSDESGESDGSGSPKRIGAKPRR